jgi:hypothetical protein
MSWKAAGSPQSFGAAVRLRREPCDEVPDATLIVFPLFAEETVGRKGSVGGVEPPEMAAYPFRIGIRSGCVSGRHK